LHTLSINLSWPFVKSAPLAASRTGGQLFEAHKKLAGMLGKPAQIW
jgi:hypothetical protein